MFGNRGSAAVTVVCTLVDGVHDAVHSASITKSVPLPSGASDVIGWSFGDNGGQRFLAPAVSCLPPPGTEIAQFAFIALDEIGT